MKPINITVNGCDDSTHVVMLMSEAELEFVTRLAKRINDNSEYGCQPTLQIGSEFPDEVDDE